MPKDSNMHRCPITKLQFKVTKFTYEGLPFVPEQVANTEVHVQYLQPDGTFGVVIYDSKLKVVLDVKEEEQPYLAEGDVIHMHPLHLLKDIETTRIKLPFLKPPTRQ